jgi:hypothetical protein
MPQDSANEIKFSYQDICSVCQNIFLTDPEGIERPLNLIYLHPHHTSSGSFQNSVASGCFICTRLDEPKSPLLATSRSDEAQPFTVYTMISIKDEVRPGSMQLRVSFGENGERHYFEVVSANEQLQVTYNEAR